MLFQCARARRITRDAPAALELLGLDTASILKTLDAASRVRSVAEHFADSEKPRPTAMHVQQLANGIRVAVDETLSIVVGNEAALIGPFEMAGFHRFIVQTLAAARPLSFNDRA